MDWTSIAWPMVTAACLTLAFINLRVAMGDGRRAPHLLFSLAAVAVAAVSVFELTLMHTDDLQQYDQVLRLAALPICIMTGAVVGFIHTFFRTGKPWLGITGVCLNLLANLVNLISEVPAIRHAVALHHAKGPGGTSFVVSSIVNGPWNGVEVISLLFVEVFVLDASLALWRQGRRRRAAIVGGSVIVFFIAARGQAWLVETGIVQMPYLVSFAFIAVIGAMGLELGNEVLRASELARELYESQQRIDLAGRAAALGFWELDISTGRIWANGTSRDLFGLNHEEPVDLESFFASLHDEDRDGVADAIREAFAGRGDYEREYRILLEGGKVRWISARGRVADENATRMRGVLLDITPQRLSEIELGHVRGQLAHAGRVSMMGQLAAALAHELNQPLGAILRNAEAAGMFLQAPEPDLDELRAIIHDIEKDDIRAGGVIDRLRALLKRKDLEPRPIAVKDLLEEVHALIRAEAAARGVKFVVEAGAGLPPALGDRVHLQQVLINLVINAMDSFGEAVKEERRVGISARPGDAGWVEISVNDTGPGLEPAALEQVFDPFYTTKPNGMGMGLSICRTIVEAHGGSISAESGTQGSSFSFTLPAG